MASIPVSSGNFRDDARLILGLGGLGKGHQESSSAECPRTRVSCGDVGNIQFRGRCAQGQRERQPLIFAWTDDRQTGFTVADAFDAGTGRLDDEFGVALESHRDGFRLRRVVESRTWLSGGNEHLPKIQLAAQAKDADGRDHFPHDVVGDAVAGKFSSGGEIGVWQPAVPSRSIVSAPRCGQTRQVVREIVLASDRQPVVYRR